MPDRKRLRVCSREVSFLLLLFFTTIFLAELADCLDINVISESFHAAEQKKNNVWCVINNSTSAIAWVYPDLMKVICNVSEFYPKLSETFSCDLSSNLECTRDWSKNRWMLTNSFENYFGPVLDRRWEKFPTYDTSSETHVGRFDGNFHVPFSVKTGRHAKMHLCKGTFKNSICYLFMVRGMNRPPVFLKCNNGKNYMSSASKLGSCDNYENIHKYHNSLLPDTENQWRHFVVIKNGPMISLRYAENDTVLLEHEDDEKTGNGHFEMYVSGFWKIHNYEFLYKNTSSKTQLGPLIHPIESTVNGRTTYHLCVEIFAIICPKCTMTIEFSNQKNSYKKTFQSKIRKGWEVIRYVQENVVASSDGYQMIVITYGRNGRFWAIDDVRQCSKEEVRVSKITVRANEPVSCQALQLPSKLLRNINDEFQITPSINQHVGNKCRLEDQIYPYNYLREIDCPVGTFGKDCIPCEMVLGKELKYCQGRKICFFDKNSNPICVCAAGFHGKDCNEVCQSHRYGYDCFNKCGHCYNGESCNMFIGICKNGCSDGFIGDACDISETPSHVRNLTIYAQTESEVFLSWLPPYPEFCQLLHYKIKTDCNNHTKYDYYLPKNCAIWKRKHCAEIEDFYKEASCTFQVLPNHIDGSLLYNEQSIPTVVKLSASTNSSEPKELKAQWKNIDELVLSWVHPDFTNGLITHFEIVIKNEYFGERKERFDIPNYDSYSLNYTYQIKSSLAKSRQYTISVCAVTDINSGFENTIEIYSPPKRPAFTKNPKAVIADGVINLKLPPYDKSKSSPRDESYLLVVMLSNSTFCNASEYAKARLIRQAKENATFCILLKKRLKKIYKEEIIQISSDEATEGPSFFEKLDVLPALSCEIASQTLCLLLFNEYHNMRTYHSYNLKLIEKNTSNFELSILIGILSIVIGILICLCCIWFLKRRSKSQYSVCNIGQNNRPNDVQLGDLLDR